MLTYPHHHHLRLNSPLLRRNPNFTTAITRRSLGCFIHSSAPIKVQLRKNDEIATTSAPNETQSDLQTHHYHRQTQRRRHDFRRHNERSTQFLDDSLSGNPHSTQLRDFAAAAAEDDKLKLLEMSLITKRTPQFPGSLYSQSSSDADVSSSLPPLKRVIVAEEVEEGGGGVGIDNEMILKAIEIRRKVTREIFLAQMGKGKFGITYSENTVSVIPEFIDYVMIEAAKMKEVPDFADSSFNLRAMTVIEESGVVPLIRWLKHNGLSYNHIGKLLCMCKRDLPSVRQFAEWLKGVHVKGRFIGLVLTRCGSVVIERGMKGLEDTVGYLEYNGVRMDWMGFAISRCPQLLSFRMEELEARVKFYTDLGINKNDFGTMVFDYPKVLGFSLKEMREKVSYLKEFGLSDEDAGKLIAFKPHLMGCSIEERWKPLIKYFYYLGISRDGIKRILIVKPMVFCVDLESIIVAKVKFLQDIGIANDAIGNMIAKFPPMLTYSLERKIRRVVIFLLTRAGVAKKDIAKVVALAPELLGCSVPHKLDVNVKYFLSLGIRTRVLGEMVADFPALLRYNLDIMRPKYHYLRKTMIRPLEDLIEFPRFFSYSLEERIIPRYKVMVENRVNFKLRYMLASTDSDFQQRVCAAVERRQRFESGIIENSDSLSDAEPIDFELGIGDDNLHDSEIIHSYSEMGYEVEDGEEDILTDPSDG
uniref:Transcription termination factor MTERF2, chloroplastic n=1 Tax=Kalanchoe fedtschenkoi TaxID=63787 RepID=A0A7N0T3Q6_KALFE